MTDTKRHPASFRDPAGFVFEKEGQYFRQVNKSYSADYNRLMQSGLYTELVNEKKLIPHTEIDSVIADPVVWYKTILPQQIVFISYPYEWCFNQWKDAAICTLCIVKKSISYGMILKDATPFNIQFTGVTPIWIDTLSFESYDETRPWIAYRQFIECFVAPLLIARYLSADLQKIFMAYPEGIPLKILSKLLPFKSRLNLNTLLHIFFAATVSDNKKANAKQSRVFTKQKLLNIIDNLISFVESIKIKDKTTAWNNYYRETVLSSEYVEEKRKLLNEWIKELPVHTVLDVGTNTGLYAEMTSEAGKFTIALDADTACIDRLYLTSKQKSLGNLLPLTIDITQPSPATGWENQERVSFLSRAKTELCLALALVHHLAIRNNLGFDQMSKLFSSIAPWLIVEFIPKSDPKITLLLQNRLDIFDDYSEESFIRSFTKRFEIVKKKELSHTRRILFLMKRKEDNTES
jgi:hypothetical protein